MISVSFSYEPNCLVSVYNMFNKLISIWALVDLFNRIRIDFEIRWISRKFRFVMSKVFPRIRYDTEDYFDAFLHINRLGLPILRSNGGVQVDAGTWYS